MTNIFLDKLESMYPGIKGHIKVKELGTPRTTHRYTLNSGGAIYGWEQNTDQGGSNRFYFKTPFTNLTLAGAWSHPGGGYEGAITSGFIAAKLILINFTDSGNEENVSSDSLMPVKQIMEGLLRKFDKDKSKGKKLLFEFLIEGHDPIYLKVKDMEASLHYDKAPEDMKITVSLRMTHKTWHDIAMGNISGKSALLEDL